MAKSKSTSDPGGHGQTRTGLSANVAEKLLVTIPKGSEILSVSRSTLYKLISEGRVPVVKLGKGRSAGVRIRVSDLERFAESVTEQKTS